MLYVSNTAALLSTITGKYKSAAELWCHEWINMPGRRDCLYTFCIYSIPYLLKTGWFKVPGAHPFNVIFFRSNSKLHQNSQCSDLKYGQLIATKFFAHITTVLLSWCVQNFGVIGWIFDEHYKISLNFEFDRNIISWTGARSSPGMAFGIPCQGTVKTRGHRHRHFMYVLCTITVLYLC